MTAYRKLIPIGWECPVFQVLSSKEMLVLPFHICKPISRVQLLICSIIRYLLQKITVSNLEFNCITKGIVELSLNSKHSSFFTLCRPVLNPQLEDLILRMLTKDPSERITIQQIKVCQQKFEETGAEVVIERVVIQHAQVWSDSIHFLFKFILFLCRLLDFGVRRVFSINDWFC